MSLMMYTSQIYSIGIIYNKEDYTLFSSILQYADI